MSFERANSTQQGMLVKSMSTGTVCGRHMTIPRPAVPHSADTRTACHGGGHVHGAWQVHGPPLIPGGSRGTGAHPPQCPDLTPLGYGTCGTARLELDRMAMGTMPWEEKAALFRKALQAGPVEATIKAFQSRLMACIDVGGHRFKPPRRWAQGRSDRGARAPDVAPDRGQRRIRATNSHILCSMHAAL
jgi:hypothetical protein